MRREWVRLGERVGRGNGCDEDPRMCSYRTVCARADFAIQCDDLGVGCAGWAWVRLALVGGREEEVE